MPKLRQYPEDEVSPSNRQLLTTKELAEQWRISEGTLATMRQKGNGPKYIKRTVGRGGKVLYDPKDVDDYTKSHKCTSTSDMGGNL